MRLYTAVTIIAVAMGTHRWMRARTIGAVERYQRLLCLSSAAVELVCFGVDVMSRSLVACPEFSGAHEGAPTSAGTAWVGLGVRAVLDARGRFERRARDRYRLGWGSSAVIFVSRA
jgi:hypothetical protein